MTQDWQNSPEGASRAVTVPPERGGGRFGGPSGQTQTGIQDGGLQDGTDRSEAKAELGALEAMAGGLRGRGHYSRDPSTPPPKKIHGAAYGVSGKQGPILG